MSNIAYGRIITSETFYNGEVTKSIVEEETSVVSSKDMILRDIIDQLSPLTTGETHKLNLEICVKGDKWHLISRKVV